METCAKNGVNEMVEVKVGYDGIVVANSRKAEPFSLTRQELFHGARQAGAGRGR